MQTPSGREAKAKVFMVYDAFPESPVSTGSMPGKALSGEIEAFLARLAAMSSPPDTCTPWSGETPYGEIRLNNLRLFFGQLLDRGVDTLLLGEAPGYQGCRRTGVGFTSEPQLIEGIPN